MDRAITYVGESVYETLFSKPDQNTMVALAKVSAALFGTSNAVCSGLACTPTGPASMQVQIGAGEIYQLTTLETTVCGTLPQDTAHNVVKQGIQLDTFTTTNGALAAPGSAGQSIAYLIEAQYADSDVSLDPSTGNTPVVLQFYNSSNPTSPWSGPGGLGGTSNTYRKGVVSLQIKAGAAATTGSQVTPTPDAGWVGLWVVTVANGQATITAGNIAQYAGAPILPSSLLASIQSGNLSYAVATGTANAHVVALTPALTQRVDGMVIRYKAPAANTAALTLNDGLGAVAVVGGAHAALQGGETATNGDVWVQWNSSIGGGSYVMLDSTGGALQIAPATASQHAVQLGQVGHGQCRLSVTNGTTLTLSPYNGNNLNINSVPRQVPLVGVTGSNGGLSASTLYYVYASWTGAAIQLNFSTTGHSTASNGVEIKTGDGTQTLVGMIYANASSQFTDSATARYCLNWFNRRSLQGSYSNGSTTNFSNTGAAAEISTTFRIGLLCWADEATWSQSDGNVSNSGINDTRIQEWMDGAPNGPLVDVYSSVSNAQAAYVSSGLTLLSEGLHTATLAGNVTAGTASVTLNHKVLIRG